MPAGHAKGFANGFGKRLILEPTLEFVPIPLRLGKFQPHMPHVLFFPRFVSRLQGKSVRYQKKRQKHRCNDDGNHADADTYDQRRGYFRRGNLPHT